MENMHTDTWALRVIKGDLTVTFFFFILMANKIFLVAYSMENALRVYI